MLIRRHQKVYDNTIDEPALDNIGNIIDFPSDNSNSNSFKFEEQITEKQETTAQKMFK